MTIKPTIEFFPVDNGDMTLVTLENGQKILIDINIRKDADDDANQDCPDVAVMLRKRLNEDSEGRPYVDAFLLSHPDADHCRGLNRHFHLGALSEYKHDEDSDEPKKIIIREMWSSPIIFRRKHAVNHNLCDDAAAWAKEARRRVNLYKSTRKMLEGDRIQILGEDKKDKTNDILEIVVKTGGKISKVNDNYAPFSALLLAPQLLSDKEAEDLSINRKNHSSVVLRFNLHVESNQEAGLFLTGGDAEVENWKNIWLRNNSYPDRLKYNVMQAPHHCSWGVLSCDSWSKSKNPKVDADARSALSQATNNAFIVASCKIISPDSADPPCVGAADEYKEILKENGRQGIFLCTANECDDDVLLITIGDSGPSNKDDDDSSNPSKPTNKQGGGRYA